MPIATGDDFVAALADFDLLSPDQLRKVQRAQQTDPSDPHTIASHLLKQGWLTPYQAELLLAGRGGELLAPRPAEPTSLPPPASRTVLAPRQPRHSDPPRAHRTGLWLSLAGGCVLLAGLAVACVVYIKYRSDGGRADSGNENSGTSNNQAKGPEVFIDEDFRTALQKGLNIPEGWQGDDLRVVKATDEACLEGSKPDGVALATLPPLKLSGDFFITAVYSLPPSHEMTVRLENRKINALLKVVILPNGVVRIGDDARTAAPNYKPYQLTKLLLSRKGRQLNVAINNETVAAKDLGEITDYETLKIGLTGGSKYHSRLYRLNVGVPGSDGSIPNMPLPEPPGKK